MSLVPLIAKPELASEMTPEQQRQRITELEARAGALWARTRWTDQAAAALRAREYRYLSPWFMHTPDGVVTCLSGAALTNTPALDMPALA